MKALDFRNGKGEVKKKLRLLLCGMGLLFLYYLIVRYFHIGIPCLIHALFHVKCPGCGITRMFVSVLSGDFRDAFFYNPYIFISLPYLGYLCMKICCAWIFEKTVKQSKAENIILYAYLTGLVLFGIIRNF